MIRIEMRWVRVAWVGSIATACAWKSLDGRPPSRKSMQLTTPESGLISMHSAGSDLRLLRDRHSGCVGAAYNHDYVKLTGVRLNRIAGAHLKG